MVETIEQIQDYVLRIDRVGSFRLIRAPQIIVGGPAAKAEGNVVRIMSSLSSNHAAIVRTGADYSIRPLDGRIHSAKTISHETNKNETKSSDSPLIEETLLTNNSMIGLSGGITLGVRVPSPLGQSAVLEIKPENRLVDRVEGVVLMDQLLILGPGPMSHIVCPHWKQAAVLTFRNSCFHLRTPLGLSTQEQVIDYEIPVGKSVQEDDFGLFIERHS